MTTVEELASICCSHCRLGAPEVKLLNIMVHVSNEGEVIQSAICQDCFRSLLLGVAQLENFEELVAEARLARGKSED